MHAWLTLVIVLVAVESTALATTYTWTGGGGANINWSNGSNWGGTAPANNETGVGLVFPALTGPYDTNNDRSGLQVTSLDITTQVGDGTYTFTGNSITQNGPATMASPVSGEPNLVWQIAIVLGGNVTISTSGRQAQLRGPINLGNRTLTLDADGDIVLAGVISGSGNLIKNNTSALTITGTNTYTGSTTGNGGTLYISNPAALGGTGTGTTFSGGRLGFSPGSTFATAEPFVFNGGRIIAYGTPTMTGPITVNTTINIEPFQALSILTISGSIAGSGGLTKVGPGLLILNAPADPYAGATAVNAGTLQLDAALTSTNPVTVESGATLTGNGASDGTISVQSGGSVAPGSSPGRLSSSGLTLVAGAIVDVEIEGPNPIAQYDTIAVTGPVSLGGATLSAKVSFAAVVGQEFTLISELQDQPVNGTFADLPEGATFELDGTTFSITYKGGSGNDVVLVVAPTRTPTPTGGTPTRTPTSTPTASPTGMATGAPAPTNTQTPVAMVTSTVTPTPTPITPACIGDCNRNGSVAVAELVVAVSIALDNLPASACPAFVGRITVSELVEAVDNALNGCPSGANADGTSRLK